MKRKHSKMIFGSAISLATLAVAIDHTRHSLPEPAPRRIEMIRGSQTPCAPDSPCALSDQPCSLDSPCSMYDNPCSLDSPCSMYDSPCSIDSPCSMDENPCSMDSPCSLYDKPCGRDDSVPPCTLG